MDRRALLLFVLLSLLGRQADAQTVDGTLTTLLAGRQDPRDGKIYTVVPVYQSLSLFVEDLRLGRVDDLRLVVSGWGEVAFGDPRENAATGDLDVAFVEGRLLDRRLSIRLGRQLIFAGAARALQLD